MSTYQDYVNLILIIFKNIIKLQELKINFENYYCEKEN